MVIDTCTSCKKHNVEHLRMGKSGIVCKRCFNKKGNRVERKAFLREKEGERLFLSESERGRFNMYT